MQGGVGIKSGDYKAEALGIDVNRSEALELVVNKQDRKSTRLNSSH